MFIIAAVNNHNHNHNHHHHKEDFPLEVSWSQCRPQLNGVGDFFLLQKSHPSWVWIISNTPKTGIMNGSSSLLEKKRGGPTFVIQQVTDLALHQYIMSSPITLWPACHYGTNTEKDSPGTADLANQNNLPRALPKASGDSEGWGGWGGDNS